MQCNLLEREVQILTMSRSRTATNKYTFQVQCNACDSVCGRRSLTFPFFFFFFFKAYTPLKSDLLLLLLLFFNPCVPITLCHVLIIL